MIGLLWKRQLEESRALPRIACAPQSPSNSHAEMYQQLLPLVVCRGCKRKPCAAQSHASPIQCVPERLPGSSSSGVPASKGAGCSRGRNGRNVLMISVFFYVLNWKVSWVLESALTVLPGYNADFSVYCKVLL